MATDSEVIKSFLVSIGFAIDKTSAATFQKVVKDSTKSVMSLGAAVIGAGVAIELMTKKFANTMEDLYYASRRTGASVSGLKAVGFAAEQIGIKADDARGMLEGLTRAMKFNPGVAGFLNNFGVDVKDTDHLVGHLALALKKFSQLHGLPATGAIGQMLGLSQDQVLMMIDGAEELNKKQEEQEDRVKQLGIDYQQLAKDGKDFNNQWRQINQTLDLFSNIVVSRLLPYVREFNGAFNEFITDIASGRTDIVDLDGTFETVGKTVGWIGEKFDTASTAVASFMEQFNQLGHGEFRNSWEAVKRTYAEILRFFGIGPSKDAPPLSATEAAEASRPAGALGRSLQGTPGRSAGPGGVPVTIAGVDAQSSGNVSAAKLFAGLENLYSLPKGLLDSMWAQESARGTNMLSGAGAKGHFQFMQPTAERFGIAGKEGDLEASAGAAAKYMSFLLKRYNGNLPDALAGYNWGEGNVDKWLKGGGSASNLPRETQKYVQQIPQRAGIDLKNETTIHVHGSGNAAEAAKITADAQGRIANDLVRNVYGAVQ